MFTVFILCFGLVATLPHSLTGMEQPVAKNPFIATNRSTQEVLLEKWASLSAPAYSAFVLEKLKQKQSFASCEENLENKLSSAVKGFISEDNSTGLSELLTLCFVHSLPLQPAPLERARKFIQSKIAQQCDGLRSQFEQSFSTVQAYQQMLQKIDGAEHKNVSIVVIQKPADLFGMVYSDAAKGMRSSNDKDQASENPFINPTS